MIGIKYGFHDLTQTSAVSEHSNKSGHYPLWNEVISLLTETSHWYSRRVNEAIPHDKTSP